MIIRFETVNAAPPRIVKMNTDEDRIFLLVFDRHPLLQRNKDVGRAGHHDFQIGFAQLASEALSHIKRRDFFGAAKFAISAIVFATVSSVDHNSAERFARIFCADFSRSRTYSTSRQEARKAKN